MNIFKHKRVKVLIADNKDANLTILEALFEDLNCEVIKVFSGDEALKACLKHAFACIFLEINLPDMNGFELTKRLCADEKTANVPIILLSEYSDDETASVKAYEAGAIDYLLKPVKAYALHAKVNLFIQCYQQRKTLQEQLGQLDEMVRFDPLTHFYNRRQLKAAL
ncbi:MAG: response regulator, partial [Legionella sp.]|nr:response regulator [Legionella sp.]